MSARNCKWLAGAFFLGAMLIVGAQGAAAQSRTPYEARQGIVVDLQQDRTQLHAWKQQIDRDKLALREDIRSFGENSPQVRADRARLARDEFQLRLVKRNMDADRDFVHTKSYLWRQ